MKKVLGLALILVTSISYAQVSFSHAAGIKLLVASSEAQTISIGDATVDIESQSSSAVGILYSPRLNLVEVGDNSTISVGTHIALTFEANSRSETSFVYDIPIVAEYNFGLASNNDNDDSFGFFIGGGYGIYDSNNLVDSVTGPVVNGGLRFLISDNPIDVSASYLIGADNINVFGLGLQYVFGI